MYLDKFTWESLPRYFFTQKNAPVLPCPSCGQITLVISNPSIQFMADKPHGFSRMWEALTSKESDITTIANVLNGFLEGKAIRTQFVGFYCCTSCNEPVSVLGKGKAFSADQQTLLSFVYFSPALPIFELKDTYPSKVNVELAKSFSAYVSDPTTAGARIRTAIEFLLDEQGIQKFRTSKQGKEGSQVKFGLGERLKLFSETHSDLGNLLGGVKQLGNEATHGSDMQHSDLLDAYQLIEHVLEELYVSRPKRQKLLLKSNEMNNKFR